MEGRVHPLQATGKPSWIHTMITMTVPSARLESPSQSWVSEPRPTFSNVAFSAPLVGLRIQPQTTPATAIGRTCGR